MDMEAWFFAILMGFWLAALFIVIGVIIGKLDARYNKKRNKNNPEDVRDRYISDNLCDSGADELRDRAMGDDNRTELCRSLVRSSRGVFETDLGDYKDHYPTLEQIRCVVATLYAESRLSPHETDCIERNLEILDILILRNGDLEDDGK